MNKQQPTTEQRAQHTPGPWVYEEETGRIYARLVTKARVAIAKAEGRQP